MSEEKLHAAGLNLHADVYQLRALPLHLTLPTRFCIALLLTSQKRLPCERRSQGRSGGTKINMGRAR